MAVRVGLGDMADAFPTATNADLVRWAVKLVRDSGREPATPGEVRKYFGRRVR